MTDEKDYKQLEKNYGQEILEEFEPAFSPIPRTKRGGYPTFTQNEFYPICPKNSVVPAQDRLIKAENSTIKVAKKWHLKTSISCLCKNSKFGMETRTVN